MSKAKPGLLEFEAARKAERTQCSVCKLRLRDKVESGYAQGATLAGASYWLKLHHGVEISEASLRRHFRSGHHEKAITR
jgi:hypothetical protein